MVNLLRMFAESNRNNVSKIHKSFAIINLTRKAISDSISNVAVHMDGQLKEKVAFSVVIDVSTDIIDISHIEILIRGVYVNLTVTE